MAGKATPISLTEQEENELESWVRQGAMEQRFVERARIVLEAAAGRTSKEIARVLRRRRATVSQWRTRFAQYRMEGLTDKPRPGAKQKYDKTTEQRVLVQLDEPPPAGHATWTGGLVAETLGDVSSAQVWRVLRKYGIHLRRRSFR